MKCCAPVLPLHASDAGCSHRRLSSRCCYRQEGLGKSRSRSAQSGLSQTHLFFCHPFVVVVKTADGALIGREKTQRRHAPRWGKGSLAALLLLMLVHPRGWRCVRAAAPQTLVLFSDRSCLVCGLSGGKKAGQPTSAMEKQISRIPRLSLEAGKVRARHGGVVCWGSMVVLIRLISRFGRGKTWQAEPSD